MFEIFLQNKYLELYKRLVCQEDTTGYCEIHHIIPRSLGGDDQPTNLVKISSRKHFLCHYLLVKITEGKQRSSMVHAFRMMCVDKKTGQRYMNSRLYESLRNQFGESTKKHFTGRICISKDGEFKYCREEDLHQMIADGWRKSGSKTGKKVVNDGSTNIFIHEEQIEEFLVSGWKLGRINNKSGWTVSNRNGSSNKGKIATKENGRTVYKRPDEIDSDVVIGREGIPPNQGGKALYHPDGSNRFAKDEREISELLRQGFIIGFRPGILSGYIFINNGIEQIRIHRDDSERIKLLTDSGWKFGRISSSNAGKKTINKDGVVKYIGEEQIDAFLADGWSLGRGDSIRQRI
jgi:hypothetical protein